MGGGEVSDLQALIDRIRDARRYEAEWRADWRLAGSIAGPIAARLLAMYADSERPCLPAQRISTNIEAGIRHAITSPHVLTAYLTGAEIELMALAERMEKSACTASDNLTTTD